MGFCLKNYFSKVCLTAVGFSTIALTTSCSLPEEDVDLTLTPAKYEAIEKAQWSELQNINEDSFKVGRYVHYEYNIRGDLSPVFKYIDQFRQIIDVSTNSSGDELKVAMQEHYLEYNDNEVIDEKVSNPIWYIPLGSAQVSEFGRKIVAKAMSEDDDPPKDDVVYEYFNLKTKKVSLDPPAAVKDKADCGGLSPCKIDGTELNFIVRITNNGKLVIMAEIKQVISSQVPPVFLFDESPIYPVVNECWTYLYGKNLVTDCKVLRDMQL